MARHVFALVFAALALVCLMQSTSAGRFDLVEYIAGRLQKTIENEHITCSNYEEFCDKSNAQPQADGKPQDSETSKMAAVFCKGILRIHVCDVDLDKELTFDEE